MPTIILRVNYALSFLASEVYANAELKARFEAIGYLRARRFDQSRISQDLATFLLTSFVFLVSQASKADTSKLLTAPILKAGQILLCSFKFVKVRFAYFKPRKSSNSIIPESQGITFTSMKLQLSHLLAFASTLALASAAPSLVIQIQEGRNSQSLKQLHDLDGSVHTLCQPQEAFCMEAPFRLACCDGLFCTSNTGGKCVSKESAKDHLSAGVTPNKEVNTLDGDMHAMCRTEGEFCQLVPLAMACCSNLRCTSIFGGKCEKF